MMAIPIGKDPQGGVPNKPGVTVHCLDHHRSLSRSEIENGAP
jgi:hypothetical protein